MQAELATVSVQK